MVHDRMPGMGAMAPTIPGNVTMVVHPRHKMMMMHMTFFWGSKADILFAGWPGTSTGMYALALFVFFLISALVEWLMYYQSSKKFSSDVVLRLIATLMHALEVSLSYLVMLALMSFNGGLFLVVVVGHTLGFLIFSSRVLKKTEMHPYDYTSDLPLMSC